MNKLVRMAEETRVLKIASSEICREDEISVHTQVVGLRFDRVEIRLTMKDYHDPHVQQWLKYQIFTRANYIPTYRINIEIVPFEDYI